jgi:hypothetical protein
VNGLRKIAKVGDMGIDGALEGAHANFVMVTDIEKGDGVLVIKPLFELGWGDFWDGMESGIDPWDTESDDFFFNFYEQPLEGLGRAWAFFGADFG